MSYGGIPPRNGHVWRRWWEGEMKTLWHVIGTSMYVKQLWGGTVEMVVIPRHLLQLELHLAARQGDKSP